ncbi:MAG: hypothetical protein BGO12_04305 [Verrucomicrobia bacterium 61-8]|nr:MAG: hypothetical protein BGO12_04305 [Verrucomicrobia bacterium 61-8]
MKARHFINTKEIYPSIWKCPDSLESFQGMRYILRDVDLPQLLVVMKQMEIALKLSPSIGGFHRFHR